MVKEELKKYGEREFQKIWESDKSTKSMSCFFNRFDPTRQMNLLQNNRKEMQLLTHIYSGHCLLNEHKHRMYPINSPFCQHCDREIESIVHYLCRDCPQHDGFRRDAFGQYRLDPDSLSSIDAQSLLKFLIASSRLC